MVVPDPHAAGGERAVLFDFGVAKFLPDRGSDPLRSDAEPAAALSTGGRDERTRTGVILGTPAYMAPEQCRGLEQQEPAIDAKVDVYALGVLMFRLCTGQLPFTGEMWELFTKHVTEPPPDPRALNPTLAPQLAELLGRMLAKPTALLPCARIRLRFLDGPATLIRIRNATTDLSFAGSMRRMDEVWSMD